MFSFTNICVNLTLPSFGNPLGRPLPSLVASTQPGLSLDEALDRADVQSTPFRLPSLLPLAVAMRPSSPRNSGWTSSSIFSAGKRSSMGVAATTLENAVAPPPGVRSDSPAVGLGKAGGSVQAVAAPASSTAKRRRIDANAIMCPFELNGVCNDDDCRCGRSMVCGEVVSPADHGLVDVAVRLSGGSCPSEMVPGARVSSSDFRRSCVGYTRKHEVNDAGHARLKAFMASTSISVLAASFTTCTMRATASIQQKRLSPD